MSVPMLTTIDNPYNPFTQFEEWNSFDEEKGYYTNAYLARITNPSYEYSDEENLYELEKAIDEIVELNVLGIYKKVYEKDFKPLKDSQRTGGGG